MGAVVTVNLSGLSGDTLYAVITNRSGQYWNTASTSYEAFTVANWGDYAVSLSEDGSTGKFQLTFPSGISGGENDIDIRKQAGGSPATSDTSVASTAVVWDGSDIFAPFNTVTTQTVNITGGDIHTRDSVGSIWDSSVMPINKPVVDASGHTEAVDQTGADLNNFDPSSDTVATVTSVSNRVTANTDQINASAAAAQQLAKSAQRIVSGTVNTANTSASTTQFAASDITEATDDHFNGRIVIFTSGNLQNQATDITDYTTNGQGEGVFTVTTLTESPANSDTFIII